nr:MAG TPA: hypothetical protein [Inoviridae sp.]
MTEIIKETNNSKTLTSFLLERVNSKPIISHGSRSVNR